MLQPRPDTKQSETHTPHRKRCLAVFFCWSRKPIQNRCPALIVFCIFALSGCTTINGIKQSQGMGQYKVFAQPYETVYGMTLDIIRNLDGFTVLEEDSIKGAMIAVHEMSAYSMGERVAVFFTKVDEQHTKVEVVSKRIIKTNIMAPDWEPKILMMINQQMFSRYLQEQ